MKLRTLVNLPRGGIASVDARRRDARVTTRLWLAAALLAASGMPSHAAAIVGGSHAGALPVGGAAASVSVTSALAPHGVWTADVLGGDSGAQLTLGGVVPSFRRTADDDHAAGGGNAPGPLQPGVDSMPIRSVPEPSELALLGDGMLVLLAWIAGRQSRRSRSMAAMTSDHEG